MATLKKMGRVVSAVRMGLNVPRAIQIMEDVSKLTDAELTEVYNGIISGKQDEIAAKKSALDSEANELL